MVKQQVIPPNKRLDELANDIRLRGRQSVENIIEVGNDLIEAKKICGHGNWLPWLKAEFGWSHDTAKRYMQCAQLKLRKLRNLSIDVSALYLLAAPSTPKSIRKKTIDRAKGGDHISHKDLKKKIRDASLKDIEDRLKKIKPRNQGKPKPSNDVPEDGPSTQTWIALSMIHDVMEYVPRLTDFSELDDEENYTMIEECISGAEALLKILHQVRRKKSDLHVIKGGKD
jgi:hypothetical protein